MTTTDLNVYRLHAVCLPQSVHSLKKVLKEVNLYDRLQPIKTSDPVIQIPTTLTNTSPTITQVLLPLDHPLIPTLSIAQAPLYRSSLLGYQWLPDPIENPIRLKHLPASPLLRALQKQFGRQIPNCILNDLPSWEAYDDFILFQPDAFSSLNWNKVLLKESDFNSLFTTISKEFNCHHIARKGRIEREDPIRKPRIEILYGDFGINNEEEEEEIFNKVFWTSTKFHTNKGIIKYIWSPTNTMYCKGNSIEKRRIVNLNNVKNKIIVDFFSGIGFFSFAYLMNEAKRVISCDISKWAIEGLRRGSIANGFSTYTFEKGNEEINSKQKNEARLWIVPYSNKEAIKIYKGLADHVNLGLLPNCMEFLSNALIALNPMGGWLHVHGEVRRNEETNWSNQILKQIKLIDQNNNREINLDGLFKVKSMGPVLIHWVAMVRIGNPSSI
ncbi:hypothetical protein CROQUDRAFT_658528 [Cronartium quercuum f. sp. fusiforme G11]|uniref:TRM5/TYW2-like methyltransferase domain-containing protein n=1 Tax=Cronartium quercuum f. sp. fusiforme G11 TaxID=708437 RepID=A0A9P6NH42_9BASI|nr:hypothetical protein CROQUDRAFT_658528 [Cronartium quercuum f. sp. fusiforme G11]